MKREDRTECFAPGLTPLKRLLWTRFPLRFSSLPQGVFVSEANPALTRQLETAYFTSLRALKRAALRPKSPDDFHAAIAPSQGMIEPDASDPTQELARHSFLPNTPAKAARKNARAARVKRSLWKLGGLAPLELTRRVAKGVVEDELLTRAAALSFYFIFALFPTAISLMAILGRLAQTSDLHTSLLRQFGQLVPPSALGLIEGTIRELSQSSSSWKLVFGLLLAVWSGTSGMSSIMDALDRCYRVRDSRPYWKRLLISIGLTATISALTLAALAIVLFGGNLVEFMGASIGLSRFAVGLWEIAEWPIALIVVLFSLALIYYVAPDTHGRWRLLTPGSVVGVLAWVAASLLLRAYIYFFHSYSKTYGSLGAVMVLLLWLYLTGLAIIMGGKINAEIESAQAEKTSVSS